MNTNTRALSSLLPAAHPAAAAEARAANAAAPAPGMDFASLMGGARLQAAQAPAAPRPEAAPPQTPQQPTGNAASQQQSRALNERRERERVHDRAAEQRAQQARQQAARSGSVQTARPAAGEEAPAVEGEDQARAAADEQQQGAVTPLAEWLASLNPAALQLPPAPDAGGASAQDTLDAAAGGDHALSGAASQQQRHAAGLRRGTAAAGAEAAEAASAAGERFELPAEAQANPSDPAAAATPARIEGAGPAAARPNADALAAVNNLTAPSPGMGGSADTAAPAAIDMPTPATDADFPDVLATQVSVLVKDGVQQAELHLNPAEMGPISVQIAVDGSQAQVDFAAAAGATRELIESSLPMLAAALHEAGLTLAGGGVFEHGRPPAGGSRHDGASPASQRGGDRGEAGGPDGTAASAPPARRLAHRGMLDLYA